MTARPTEQPDDPDAAPEPPVGLTRLLHRALRAAYSAEVDDGADPEAVTADLSERLRRIRAMRAAAERRAETPDA